MNATLCASMHSQTRKMAAASSAQASAARLMFFLMLSPHTAVSLKGA